MATRTATRNIINITPGVTAEAQHAVTPDEAFNLFMNDAIINEITNLKIQSEAARYQRKTGTLSPTEPVKMHALLGIMIFSGYQRGNHVSTREMWSQQFGSLLYRSTMSEARFVFLLSCLRFEDPTTREERRDYDKFAPIRKIWDIVIDHCQKMYVPDANLTVD